jgi:hypothetical protein
MSGPEHTMFNTEAHGKFSTEEGGPSTNGPSTVGQSTNGSGKGIIDKDAATGFQPTHKMAVKPPTKDDLQRSYATVVDANANDEGWYGTMSMLIP